MKPFRTNSLNAGAEGTPEIEQPADPKVPEVPLEDPQVVPDEYPPENNPSETPQRPGIL